MKILSRLSQLKKNKRTVLDLLLPSLSKTKKRPRTLKRKKRIALLGNPNCGKTVIFNRLTGSSQRIGNWSGVTVEKKVGLLKKTQFEVIDLPGIYALSSTSKSAQDENITLDFLHSDPPDLIINVVDATNLERHLYLTAQLLEHNIPMLVVLTMTDVAHKRNIFIDTQQLSHLLGCPVISLIAHRGVGFKQLHEQLCKKIKPPQQPVYNLPEEIVEACRVLTQHLTEAQIKSGLALRLLEEEQLAKIQISEQLYQLTHKIRAQLHKTLNEEIDLLIIDARYQWIFSVLQRAKVTQQNKRTLTQRIDQFVLNRWLGLPLFFVMIYVLFFFSINFGGALQDFFNLSTKAVLIDGLTHLLLHWHTPTWIILLAQGICQGINTTLTFAPVIAALFFALSLLEDSGYLARAAFVIDRCMKAIGLPGKAFIPLIIGLGCNVPTIMATRTLTDTRDRILTAMMAPFISCSARLAVYSVFVSAFFPYARASIIFSLYLIGFSVAIMTVFLLRKKLTDEIEISVLELPNYHLPHWPSVLRHSWQRLKLFLFKAGRFIIPICIILSCLNSMSTSGQLILAPNNQVSLLATIGKKITPIFKPIGLNTDNWPATVGLVSGLLAKEVVIGTLNTLYTQSAHLKSEVSDDTTLLSGLQAAVQSIPNNLKKLSDAWRNPVTASAPDDELSHEVSHVMVRHFNGGIGAYAYLLFILLYFPCLSTVVIMQREIGKSWAYFSVLWSIAIAYGSATAFYQIATLIQAML